MLEKVIQLGKFADEISKHPFLGQALALKGGTALNLCSGMPKRLSVDLDYNYIAHAEREKMLVDLSIPIASVPFGVTPRGCPAADRNSVFPPSR
jgi:predicted nucleotidyltransferase component of viral defense system